MQEDTDRVEGKDFAFRSVRRFRVFPSPGSGTVVFDGRISHHLLSVSNAYGLIFTAWPGQELKVIPTSEIHKFLDGSSKDQSNEVTNYSASLCQVESLGSQIVRLHCNCDGTALAICYNQPTPIAHIFDVRALSPSYPGPKPVSPYCRIRLDDADGSSLCDFQWNPTSPDAFASCCSSGTVMLVAVNTAQTNAFSVQGVIRRSPEGVATCVSWSPKGKQLAVGFENGTVCQYKPQNLQLAKKWSPPSPQMAQILNRLINICWLSTNQFFLVSTGGKPNGDQLVLIYMTTPKDSGAGAQLAYINYDDVCFGTVSEQKWSPARYLMHHVQEWAVMLCTSTLSLETAILGWNAEAKRWLVWDLDDDSRCQLPLTATSEECFPVGVDIDRTPEAPVVLKSPDGEIIKTLPPAPIVLLLSTDGALCPFRIVHSGSGAILCQPAQRIQNWNDVKVGIPLASPARPAATPSAGVSVSVTLPLAKPTMAHVTPIQQQASAAFGKPPQPASVLPPASLSTPTPIPASVPATAAPPAATAASTRITQPIQQPPRQQIPESAEEQAQREKNRLLRMEVIKWAVDFERELRNLKSKLAEPMPVLASREGVVEVTRKVQDLSRQLGDVQNEIKVEKQESGDLRGSVCGQLLRADQTKLLAERHQSTEFRTLIRYRPLTSKQEEEMKSLKRRQEEAEAAMEDLRQRMDRLKVHNQVWHTGTSAVSKGQRRSSLELIYRTLANMQAIMMQQRQRMNLVRRNWATMPKQGRRVDRSVLDDTADLSESLRDTRIMDDSSDSWLESGTPRRNGIDRTPYQISSSLKTMLDKRDTTPRRCTAPVLRPPVRAMMETQGARQRPQEKPPQDILPAPSAIGAQPHGKPQEKPPQPQPPAVATAAVGAQLHGTPQEKPPQPPAAAAASIGAQLLGKPQEKPPQPPAVAAAAVGAQLHGKPLEKPPQLPAVAAAAVGAQLHGMPLEKLPQLPAVATAAVGAQLHGKPQEKPPQPPAVATAAVGAQLHGKPQEKPPQPPAVATAAVGAQLHGKPQEKPPTVTPPASAATPAPAPAAPTSGGTIFGGGGGVFSSLGGQPSPEAAKNNVIATASGFGLGSPQKPAGQQQEQIKSLFGGSPSTGGSAFSAAGAPTVVSQGLTGSGAAPQPAATAVGSGSGFGSSAALGTKPVFGGSNVFGGSATFGGGGIGAGPSTGGSIFGGSSGFGQRGGSAAGPSAGAEASGFAAVASTSETDAGLSTGSSVTSIIGTQLKDKPQEKPQAITPPASTATPAPAPTSGGTIFGGGGGFFSGLGGQPSPEAAKKNVFATASGLGLGSPQKPTGQQQEQIKSLFGGSPSTGASAATFGFASALNAAAAAPTVVSQQGFGAFGAAPPQPVATGFGSGSGFGSSSAFGSKPTFGGTNVFGGTATFGGGGIGAGPSTGGSIFGGSSSFGPSGGSAAAAPSAGAGAGAGAGASGFAAFARTQMPSFGALAGGGSPPNAAPSTPFGGSFGGGGGGGFGAGSPFGSPSVFQPQQQSTPFAGGGQQQTSPQSSSFSQWR